MMQHQITESMCNKIGQNNLEHAALLALMADTLTAAGHSRSTAFVRWRQCARPPNT